MRYDRCVFCEHRCGIDRTRGPAGICQASARPRIFCELLEYGEEPELIPTYAISFSGCNLRCAFCITGEESQNAAAGTEADAEKLAWRIRKAMDEGTRSVTFLGGEPTLYLPFLQEVRGQLGNLPIPLVLKTNLYCTPEALSVALDLFDVVLADFKFGNDLCARTLAGFPRYTAVLARNLCLAAPRRRVIVRHLVMPGHISCCTRPVIDWVRGQVEPMELSIRDHYVPSFRARSSAELGRTTSEEESDAVHKLLETPEAA
jgi:putative pyruvate formate lyase activating enzyme